VTCFQLAGGQGRGKLVGGEILDDLVGVDAGEDALAGVEGCIVDGEEGAVVGEGDVEELHVARSLVLVVRHKRRPYQSIIIFSLSPGLVRTFGSVLE